MSHTCLPSMITHIVLPLRPPQTISQFAMLIFLISLCIFVHIHNVLRHYMSIWNDMWIISIYSLFVNRIWIGLFCRFLKSHINFWFGFFSLSVALSVAKGLYKNWRTHKTPVVYILWKTTTYDKELYVCFYLVPEQTIKFTQA